MQENTFSHVLESIELSLLSFTPPKINILHGDHWIISSILQKSIRRGDIHLACQAAASYFNLNGHSIWRRLLVIAFEDIGIGTYDALIETAAISSSSEWRHKVGGDYHVLMYLVTKLCLATKDRSSDYLICTAHDHPALENVRNWACTLSLRQRIEIAMDLKYSLPVRATMAWFASGLEWGDETRVGKNDINSLFNSFCDRGVPYLIAQATLHAANVTKEPIAVMIPILFEELQKDNSLGAKSPPIPKTVFVDEIPTYALDMHTRAGRKSIINFSETNHNVNKLLLKCCPPSAYVDVALLASFYTDGSLVNKKLDWHRSRTLEILGLESDFFPKGINSATLQDILNCFLDNLDHLNEIRCEVYKSLAASS